LRLKHIFMSHGKAKVATVRDHHLVKRPRPVC
jgi:hypothetical protein